MIEVRQLAETSLHLLANGRPPTESLIVITGFKFADGVF